MPAQKPLCLENPETGKDFFQMISEVSLYYFTLSNALCVLFYTAVINLYTPKGYFAIFNLYVSLAIPIRMNYESVVRENPFSSYSRQCCP